MIVKSITSVRVPSPIGIVTPCRFTRHDAIVGREGVGCRVGGVKPTSASCSPRCPAQVPLAKHRLTRLTQAANSRSPKFFFPENRGLSLPEISVALATPHKHRPAIPRPRITLPRSVPRPPTQQKIGTICGGSAFVWRISVRMRNRVVMIVRIILTMTRDSLVDGGQSKYEPLLLCLGLSLSILWALVVVVPMLAVTAFANAVAWVWFFLRQPINAQLPPAPSRAP